MDRQTGGQYIKADNNQKEMERYKLVAEGASSGLWDWDLIRDKVLISKEWSNLLGFHDAEIDSYKEKWRSIIHRDDVDRVLENFNRCIDKKIELYQCEYRMKFKNNKFKWISSRGKILWDDTGNAIRMAGSHTDISERKKTEKKLENLAYYDQLTGVFHRAIFMDKLNASIQVAKLNKWLLAVLFIDVDDFKTINDIYGHDKGDIFLKKLARKLNVYNKKSDAICRFGGDEFALFTTGITNISCINEHVNQLLEIVKQPVDIQGYRIYGSVSIGIAVYPADGYNAKSLINKADIAMYRAKECGKNRFLYFENHMARNMKISYAMKSGFKSSILNQEFYLCFQPMLDLRTNKIVTVEALIRWRHPKIGLIGPVDFIPVAEQTRLIIPLGEWVIEEACRQIKAWHEMNYMITVSVNVSAVQLHQPDFSKMVSNILMKYKLEPELLELEMTESVFIGNDQTVDNNIRSLSMMGVNLVIDDFGTGYNSFQSIQNNLFDCIKIDKNFIINMKHDINKTIIDSIIYLGHSLKTTITAEGVENKEQYEFLKNSGCDVIQGYYICKPLRPEDFINYMKSNL
jgi:diguanylate cyclase (GGDEF)-like protein/PAS domain S-box-containing protein